MRLAAGVICGTDLHIIRGTFAGMRKGQMLGHEGVGTVEAVGPVVGTICVGQRVIIRPTAGCRRAFIAARNAIRDHLAREPARTMLET